MKKIWAIRKDSEAVSPVIATILMVAITVVLAAVLYVMVLGFGGTSSTPSIQKLRGSTVTNGYKIELTNPTSEVKWDDVSSIQLTDGTNTVAWSNISSTKQSSGTPAIGKYGGKTLGTLTVFLNITDLAGDGKVSQGDYLVFTTGGGSFSSTATYTLTMLYRTTGGSLISVNIP
ncbi:MAG: archaellin/type IV pilin N-terminal domain-containing protein [Thermoplasmata archaeon]